MGKTTFLAVVAVALLGCQAKAQLTEEQQAVIDLIRDPPMVRIVGDNGEPESAFPLGFCQGDCDRDEDCAEGLVCLQRSDGDEAEGCVFSPNPNSNATMGSDEDLCVFPPVEFLDDPVDEDDLPLGLCQGSCMDDTQCDQALGLICYKRSRVDPVPGCYIPSEFENSANFCVRDVYAGIEDTLNADTLAPTMSPTVVFRGTLTYAGNDEEPAQAFPLQICQSDCDDDDDCDEGLMCLQRGDESDPVSIYCDGTPDDDEDYCVPIDGLVPPLPTNATNMTMPNMTMDSAMMMEEMEPMVDDAMDPINATDGEEMPEDEDGITLEGSLEITRGGFSGMLRGADPYGP